MSKTVIAPFAAPPIQSSPYIIGGIAYPTTAPPLPPGVEHGPATPGLRQVIQWARAYVENETGIGDCPCDRLSPEERAGLAELERLEKLL
jgi:hypothetical protein